MLSVGALVHRRVVVQRLRIRLPSAADARRRVEVRFANLEVLGRAHDLVDARVENLAEPRAELRDGERGAIDRPSVEARLDVGKALNSCGGFFPQNQQQPRCQTR